MANVIKYSTTKPSQSSLRKGNLAVGVGNENYGPTSTTGFVNGVDIPNGGYVVYLLHNNNPAAWVAYNDTDLIAVARTLGNSGTTVASAKEYLAGRSDTWILNNTPPNIVTDGLVFNLDASDVSSYPTTGNTWYDLSGDGNDGGFINGPTFSVENDTIIFDGGDDRVQTSYAPRFGDFTVCLVFKDNNSGAWGRMVDKGYQTGFFISSYFATSGYPYVGCGIIEPSVPHGIALPYNQERFHFFTSVRNGTTHTIYLDGVDQTTSKTVSSAILNTQNIALGSWNNSTSQPFNGELAKVMMYDRALTEEEILQNYYQGMSANGDLILYLDAGNLVSAQEGSNEWVDLSPNQTTITTYGTPTLEKMGGARAFNLNAAGDRFVTDFGGNINTNDLTFESWIYPAATELTSGDRGCIIQGYAYMSWNKSNRRLSSYWYSTNNRGYHEPTKQMDREQWHHLLTVWNSSEGKLYQYIDGVLEKTISTVAGSGFIYNGMNIGWEGNNRQFSGGFGMIKIYKRALSSVEVAYNYESYKGRFGK